jgi:hypothetical protein
MLEKYSKITKPSMKNASIKFVAMSALVLTVVLFQSLVSENTAAVALTGNGHQPNINATSLFNTRTMVLPSNVKNLIVLIPDEAHHSPSEVPSKRYLNQTYLPENAVVSSGTTLVWFSGDKGHEHVINLYDTKSNTTIFTSGTLPFNAATKPVKLNNTGDFIYSDPENAKSREAGVNGFVMTGTVKVVNQPSSSSSNSVASNSTATTTTTTTATNSNATKIDTVGVLMVPAKTVNQYISEFKNRGFGIDSTQQFKALRSNGQHVLIVWTSNGMDLNKLSTGLNEITATLPYS